MKKPLFLFSIYFFIFQSFSQVNNVDSLNFILDTISTTKDKITFCRIQGDTYMNTNIDSFEYWYQKGIKIGENTDEEYMLVMLYAYLSYEYSAKGNYEAQAENIHNGKKYLTDETPYKYQRILLSAEAQHYLAIEQFDSAIKVYNTLINQAKIEVDSAGISGSLHNVGICYYAYRVLYQ